MFEVDFGNHILLEVFFYTTEKLLNCWSPGFTPRYLMVSVLIIFLVFCFIFIFLFCLSSFCVLYPMLPVSLDCPFLVTPSVFSNVYLTSSKQYFSYIHDKNELTVYKQYIMQVHWWHYIYIITFLVSNVPCVSGLSLLDLPLRLQFSLSYICGCIMVIDIHVYWTPWYSWNIAKVGIKCQSINQCIWVYYHHHSCPP
jgi:hypothetical protein